MKVFHVKKQLAALFMPGFLIGIIYVNFLAKKYVAAPNTANRLDALNLPIN